ncbi:hypothetical protein SZ63_07100 [Methanoculleus sediminis]|uniref:Uncharacterized protein n=1 Tax=Methanoculleus sediminis TaxID=1550566 RepID=A0A0H1R0M3_9EURY|nr:hypothetical protein [Methanoculleus sediminis]KLK88740.1 hypothetical protein SZ63_07100 [Methanoculleus sediminis]
MSGKIIASPPRSRFSPAIPPLVAVVACVIWAGTARTVSGIVGPAPPFVLPVFVLVMVTLAVAGAATPLPLIPGAVPVRRERQAMLVAVAASVPFVFALLINPGQWERGDAPPLVADSVPVFGWLFDGIMSALPLTAGTPAYSLLFSAFGVFGFYLECVLAATILYAALRLTAAPVQG